MAGITDRQYIEQRVAELGPWFHDLNLHGVQTDTNHYLYDYPNVKWKRFCHAIPQHLAGKSVLDIGCNAGFYSIEMCKRGAERVLAIDLDDRYLAQGRFAAEVLGYPIEFRNLSVYDVAELRERFDIVLFMGVLYHLRHPLLALDLIHEHVADDLLIFQSMQRGSPEVLRPEPDYDFWDDEVFDQPSFPCLYFIEQRYAGDPTNWWIPNRSCAEGMLRGAGFEIAQHPEGEVYICHRVQLMEHSGGPRAVYPAKGARA